MIIDIHIYTKKKLQQESCLDSLTHLLDWQRAISAALIILVKYRCPGVTSLVACMIASGLHTKVKTIFCKIDSQQIY